MFVSEDGYVNGSIDAAKLDEIEPKSDEARARLEQLKAERDAGQAQADADAARLAELHKAQSIEGQQRPVVTTQGDKYAAPAPVVQVAQAGDKQDSERTSARKSASSSDKG